MVTVNTTPKSASANAYIAVADVDSYMDQRLNASDWTAATADNKARAVIQASKLLDACYDWNGSPTTLDQSMRWPRGGVTDRDGQGIDMDEIPQPLKDATAELAMFLLKSDRIAEPSLLGQGMSQAKVGPLDVTIDKSQVVEFIPAHVHAFLVELGTPSPGAVRSGFRTVPLRRA